MSAPTTQAPAGARSPRRGSLLARSAGLRTTLLLLPPMLWLGVAYLGALAALFVTAFWGQNSFTGEVERTWTLDNFRNLVTIDVYRTVTLRTIGIAVLVTVVDALIAFRWRCTWPRSRRCARNGCSSWRC